MESTAVTNIAIAEGEFIETFVLVCAVNQARDGRLRSKMCGEGKTFRWCPGGIDREGTIYEKTDRFQARTQM